MFAGLRRQPGHRPDGQVEHQRLLDAATSAAQQLEQRVSELEQTAESKIQAIEQLQQERRQHQQSQIQHQAERDQQERRGLRQQRFAAIQSRRLANHQLRLQRWKSDADESSINIPIDADSDFESSRTIALLELDLESLRSRLTHEASLRRKAQAALRRQAQDDDSSFLKAWIEIESGELIERLTRRLDAAERMRNLERLHALDRIESYRRELAKLQTSQSKRNAA